MPVERGEQPGEPGGRRWRDAHRAQSERVRGGLRGLRRAVSADTGVARARLAPTHAHTVAREDGAPPDADVVSELPFAAIHPDDEGGALIRRDCSSIRTVLSAEGASRLGVWT